MEMNKKKLVELKFISFYVLQYTRGPNFNKTLTISPILGSGLVNLKFAMQ